MLDIIIWKHQHPCPLVAGNDDDLHVEVDFLQLSLVHAKGNLKYLTVHHLVQVEH